MSESCDQIGLRMLSLGATLPFSPALRTALLWESSELQPERSAKRSAAERGAKNAGPHAHSPSQGEKNEAQTGEITCLETQERCQHLPPCRTNHLSTASAFKPFILRKLEAPNLHYANSTWEVFQLANIWP
ncbi:unnamed protein product [Rangifer tarandus platyrhynchus]|uniref:Uncharacterized protein n=2 Tax=Rangifer tarandus platyrhynchus TaxID=3082113 RepID=A0ABN8YWQ9_RANTA|nr:unnamed protein product [Rangifer tarandus platyrhynchus]CAI9701678.1 unnamed protein product [Rangifer tarandus platyrhynchus]